MTGRIPCINPCCKRTASAEKYDCEIICGKCFRNLPPQIKADHQHYWREIRRWERRIMKTTDEIKRERMKQILTMWSRKLHVHWETVLKPVVANPEKPEGLEVFLEQMGL